MTSCMWSGFALTSSSLAFSLAYLNPAVMASQSFFNMLIRLTLTFSFLCLTLSSLEIYAAHVLLSFRCLLKCPFIDIGKLGRRGLGNNMMEFSPICRITERELCCLEFWGWFKCTTTKINLGPRKLNDFLNLYNYLLWVECVTFHNRNPHLEIKDKQRSSDRYISPHQSARSCR